MLKFLVLVALATIDNTNCAQILNTITSAPYIVSVQKVHDPSGKREGFCAGSIIAKDWVVTAASCINDPITPKSYAIVAGTDDRKKPGSTYGVSKIVKHKDFAATKTSTYVNDIALIKVNSNFVLDNTRKIAQLSDKTPKAGTAALSSGWGYGARSKDAPNLLHVINEKIMSIGDCQKYYEERIQPKQLCASHEITEFFTRHERGNPIVVNERLVGISTWSAGTRRPDIFTDISQYRDWIKATMAAK